MDPTTAKAAPDGVREQTRQTLRNVQVGLVAPWLVEIEAIGGRT